LVITFLKNLLDLVVVGKAEGEGDVARTFALAIPPHHLVNLRDDRHFWQPRCAGHFILSLNV
jgi:hypothetical protein